MLISRVHTQHITLSMIHVYCSTFSSQISLLCNKGYQLKFDSYKLFLSADEDFSAFTFSDFKKNTLTSKIMADFAVCRCIKQHVQRGSTKRFVRTCKIYLALGRLAHLEINNYTGADSWLEAKQKIHDACFGCCHQTAVSELSFRTIAQVQYWRLYYSSLHRCSMFHLDTVFVVANL